MIASHSWRERENMDQQQQQQQQNDGGQHPVISDLCFHLSKSSKAVIATAEAAIKKDGASSQTPKSNDEHPLLSSSSSSSAGSNKRSSIPLPVAAIRVLLNVIRRSEAETMMGLQVCLSSFFMVYNVISIATIHEFLQILVDVCAI